MHLEMIFGLRKGDEIPTLSCFCLLYTSDAADDLLCVDLGGRRIIKKKSAFKISSFLGCFTICMCNKFNRNLLVA